MQENEKNKKAKVKKGHHEYPLPGEISAEQKRQNIEAREEADKDMIDDAEFTAHSKNDDLDEGEAARLGDSKTDLA